MSTWCPGGTTNSPFRQKRPACLPAMVGIRLGLIEESCGPQVYGNMKTINVRVGSPLRQESLSVFPLFVESVSPIEYQLLDEAVRQGNVVFETLPGKLPSPSGRGAGGEGSSRSSVAKGGLIGTDAPHPGPLPEGEGDQFAPFRIASETDRKMVSHVRLRNRTNARVLVLSGQRLPGGAESPVLSTSILVPGGATIEIPQRFLSGEPHQKFDSPSVHPVGAPIRIAYVAGAAGLVVAAGRSIVAADLLDRLASCREIWEECLREAASAARVPATSSGGRAGNLDVQRFLISLSRAAWQEVEQPGEGYVHRAELLGGSASSLSLDGHLIHAQWRRTFSCVVPMETILNRRTRRIDP